MNNALYADYNATAPLRPEARAAFLHALEVVGNPSSVHAEGRRAKAMVEDARRSVAGLLNVAPDDVIFTASATESNNLALSGFRASRPEALILVDAGAHDSVLKPALTVGATPLPLLPTGQLNLDALRGALAGTVGALVVVNFANHETGILQPIAEISELVHAAGGFLMVDAVQAIGRVAVDVELLGVDYLSLSGHKLGTGRGVGVLVVRPRCPMVAQLVGGGQERGLRAGTENVAAIAALGVIAGTLKGEARAADQGLAARDAFEAAVVSDPRVVIVGADQPRLPNTSCVAFPGFKGESQVMAMDLAGVRISAGSACSSGKARKSAVLGAMGLPDSLAASAVRFSFGPDQQASDGQQAALVWQQVCARAMAARGAA